MGVRGSTQGPPLGGQIPPKLTSDRPALIWPALGALEIWGATTEGGHQRRNYLSSGASGGSLHEGASFKVQRLILLHEERVWRTAKGEVRLCPPSVPPPEALYHFGTKNQVGKEEKSFLEGGFCNYVRLSWLWRSECQMHCWVQCTWMFCVSRAWHWIAQKLLLLKPPFFVPEPSSWRTLRVMDVHAARFFGERLRGSRNRGNKPERFWEGNLRLRGASARVSEREGFQRFSEVFRGFQRFFRCPLRAPLRVPFSSQCCGSCYP